VFIVVEDAELKFFTLSVIADCGHSDVANLMNVEDSGMAHNPMFFACHCITNWQKDIE
jgi:hypothetical protein